MSRIGRKKEQEEWTRRAEERAWGGGMMSIAGLDFGCVEKEKGGCMRREKIGKKKCDVMDECEQLSSAQPRT